MMIVLPRSDGQKKKSRPLLLPDRISPSLTTTKIQPPAAVVEPLTREMIRRQSCLSFRASLQHQCATCTSPFHIHVPHLTHSNSTLYRLMGTPPVSSSPPCACAATFATSSASCSSTLVPLCSKLSFTGLPACPCDTVGVSAGPPEMLPLPC
jgi:hypothetical protein